MANPDRSERPLPTTKVCIEQLGLKLRAAKEYSDPVALQSAIEAAVHSSPDSESWNALGVLVDGMVGHLIVNREVLAPRSVREILHFTTQRHGCQCSVDHDGLFFDPECAAKSGIVAKLFRYTLLAEMLATDSSLSLLSDYVDFAIASDTMCTSSAAMLIAGIYSVLGAGGAAFMTLFPEAALCDAAAMQWASLSCGEEYFKYLASEREDICWIRVHVIDLMGG